MARKFRKKPAVIEAVQWTGKNRSEIYEFTDGCVGDLLGIHGPTGEIIVSTLEGDMKASKGDWIIKGIQGEFYPCKPDIFEDSYDEAIE